MMVVVPASGAGLRLGGGVPKQFRLLGGKPILWRTLSVFDALDCVEEIAVAVPEGYEGEVEGYGFAKVRHIVSGKGTRAESVYAALRCFVSKPKQIVLIHDGIRPFVTSEIVHAVASAVEKHGAAVACSPVVDTVKQADEQGKIIATPNRQTLWQAQTPQGFTYEIIARAYEQGLASGDISAATDDSALVENLGLPVYIVPSSPANFKITTQTDLLSAEAVIGQKAVRT